MINKVDEAVIVGPFLSHINIHPADVFVHHFDHEVPIVFW